MPADFFNTDQIPEAYKTHLPDENVDYGEEAGEILTEPFKRVSQKVKDSLSRIYKVATQPMTGEPVRPLPAESHPVEYYASLAARIVAMPLVAMKEALDIGTAAREGSVGLRAGPAGETGDWTPEQYKTAADATMTGAMAIGGGMPGGGTGPANIARKDALKMLAKEFRSAKKAPIADDFVQEMFSAFGITNVTGVDKTLSKTILPPKGSSYRTVTKGLKNIPDEILAPVQEVGLTPSSSTGVYGRYTVGDKRVSFNVTKKLPKETIPHEFLHATQHKRVGEGIRKLSKPVLEAHAYEFERMFLDKVKALPKGERMDAATFNEIYKTSQAEMIKKWGRDFGKYDLKKIYAEKKKVRSLEKVSSAKVPIGETFQSKVGKIKYDAATQWETGGPKMHQYTVAEGPYKGATFTTKSQKTADINKAIKNMEDLTKKYGDYN